MVARGAAVTGLGTAGVGAFGALQAIPGTASCSFGDVAIAPSGVVVQTCGTPAGGQGPSSILVSADTDGIGPINFGGPITATTTNVGGWDFIPPQNARSVDPEAGLAFDGHASSPHFGRLYLVYTEETAPENNDTDIMVRFSDDNGSNWSAPIRVNDDPATPIRSQFLPKISVNQASGDIAVCWHDARNSATNTAIEEYCALAAPTGAAPTFMKNAKIADGASTSPGGMEFGDYSGLTYGGGFAHPIWGDASNSTGNNPDGTSNIDSFTDRFGRPLVLSFCITHPAACDKPVLKPEHIQFACVKYPCIFQDFIPHNCLIKFVCPGCPPGALCPPYFTFGIEGLDPAWRVELYDPTGHVVAYEQRKTPRGTMISFRPAREYFKDGKIGDYFFTFETVDRAQLGREQSVRMTVQGGNEPFGSQQKLPR